MSIGSYNNLSDPGDRGDGISSGPVFLVVLILFVGVGAMLYFGNAWIFAPANVQSVLANTAINHRFTLPDPTVLPETQKTAATQVPAPIVLALAATPTGTPTAVPPAPTPNVAKQAPAAAPPTQASPTVRTAKIGNTGGDGVFLRATPKMSDHLSAYVDNTPLKVLGDQADGDGQHWLKVQMPNGQTGWLPEKYVVS
jgi:hypothetical protein